MILPRKRAEPGPLCPGDSDLDLLGDGGFADRPKDCSNGDQTEPAYSVTTRTLRSEHICLSAAGLRGTRFLPQHETMPDRISLSHRMLKIEHLRTVVVAV